MMLLFLIGFASSQRLKQRCNVGFSFYESIQQNSKPLDRKCSHDVKAICTKNISVSYISMPPFTDGNIFGLKNWSGAFLTQIVSAALSQCCGNCLNITFNKLEFRSQLTETITKLNSDIIYPMFTQGAPNRINFSQSPLIIPLVKLSTAMLITELNIPPTLFAVNIFHAICSVWPLFGVSIMLAFTAGVVMWFSDTWYNKVQLPRSFIPGSFEGFWWAFVTMTTVGYGDVAPKGAIAKLIAMFWILCGITITSFIVAALTNAVFVIKNQYIASVNSGNIGLLNNHIFEKVLLRKGNAKQYPMETIEELIYSTKNQIIDGFLVDSYTAKMYLQEQMKSGENKLFVRDVIYDVDQSYYGVAIYDVYLNDLINNYIIHHKDDINDFINNLLNNLPDLSDTMIQSNLLFTTQSGIYLNVLTISACMIIILLIFGAIYEFFLMKIKSGIFNSNLSKSSYDKEELQIDNEMRHFVNKWRKRLKNKFNEFVLDGSFTVKHNKKPNVSLTLKKKEDTTEEIKKYFQFQTNFNKIENKKKSKYENKSLAIIDQKDFQDVNKSKLEKINYKRPLPQLQFQV
ncbi:uncharacterized protein LOC101240607 [Hydra vulgaris]|uniref:uncharacterized protein LOC101240607 n=1 Tax=Hydra vulgaris TaxID=6087 RepID=UPI001F5EF009|nr:uncharacterized protein LOC101240607 [Hydra vulgaris]